MSSSQRRHSDAVVQRRLSCSFCILGSRSALVTAAQLRPDLASEYVRVEIATGHRFRQDLSIADVVAAAKTDVPVRVADWVA